VGYESEKWGELWVGKMGRVMDGEKKGELWVGKGTVMKRRRVMGGKRGMDKGVKNEESYGWGKRGRVKGVKRGKG
jgi:hypothetical protein